MIVYRPNQPLADTAELLARLRTSHAGMERAVAPTHDDVQTFLIDFGEFEAAVVDRIEGDSNSSSYVSRVLRRAALRAGHMFLRSWRQQEQQGWIELVGASLAEIAQLQLPRQVRVPVSEGYAYYGLYPETYIAAAKRFATAHEPGDAVVIGIRSIGASLSAVVEATLESLGWKTYSHTVRPGGHPFDRTVPLSDQLAAELQARTAAVFLVVDEGPGLSGSTFASVAGALEGLGVTAERIVFLPSWNADGSSFVNRQAAGEWSRHPRYTAAFEEVWLDDGRLRRTASSTRLHDISAGRWREILCQDQNAWPAVQPQHEARKYLSGGLLLKFAGLGRYGHEKLELARLLSNDGFVPGVAGLRSGFLASKLASGIPVRVSDANSRPLLERVAAYLAWRQKTLPKPRSLSFDQLIEMMQVNVREATGGCLPGSWPSGLRREIEDRGATAIDGRMFAHEWIDTQGALIKTDAVDHHADHFYPGDADIAWDLAAASVEFELDTPARQYFLDRYRTISGDRVSSRVLQFYELAWLAFRAGYTSVAAGAVEDGAERGRFEKQLRKYAHMLRNATQARKQEWPIPA
jgi:hypothetical protein